MATGWARQGSVLDQIEDTIIERVLTARAQLPAGQGAELCVECGDSIPEARRRALPVARTCVAYQAGHDRAHRLGRIQQQGQRGQPAPLTRPEWLGPRTTPLKARRRNAVKLRAFP